MLSLRKKVDAGIIIVRLIAKVAGLDYLASEIPLADSEKIIRPGK
jgi:hypothetical protein